MVASMPPSGLEGLVERFGVGKRASAAVTHNGTGYFACTPQSPYDASLGVAEQTKQLLEKADTRLAEIGTDKSKLLFVAIILADMADYAEMNAVWDAWVSDIAPPSRACFNAILASPALKVEMIMVSAVPAKSRQ